MMLREAEECIQENDEGGDESQMWQRCLRNQSTRAAVHAPINTAHITDCVAGVA